MIFELVDEQEIYKRLLDDLPYDWFGNPSYGDGSNLNVILAAYIYTAITSYYQMIFCFLQLYITTMTDSDELNLFAQDYIGYFPQLANEPNENYKNRIEANLLRTRATRQAMYDVLLALTGFAPVIFEPWRPLDCMGGYGGEGSTNYSMGYGTHGLYGSGSYPYQCFIDVTIPIAQSMGSYPVYLGESSISPYSGIGAYSGEAGTNNVMWYGGQSLIRELVTAAQLYEIIRATKVCGTVCWVAINYSD